MNISFKFSAMILVTLMTTVSSSAVAQAPVANGPIHLIHGQAPGGTTDAMARLLGNEWSKRLSRDVLVETRPGAGTTIAAATVARAPADGNTVLFTGSGHTANPFLIPNLSFDTAKDFKAIGLVAATPYLLVVSPDMPVSTVAELIDFLKQNPAKATVAVTSIGSGPHLAGALFEKMSGVKMELLPYKGSSAQLADVISGRVPVAFDNIALMGPQIKAKTLKPLAVTSKTRSPLYPDIPTLAESGYPGFDIMGWFGALVPTATPDSVVQQYSNAVLAMKQDSAFTESVERLGANVLPGGAPEAQAFIQGDIKRMGVLIKDLDIKLE